MSSSIVGHGPTWTFLSALQLSQPIHQVGSMVVMEEHSSHCSVQFLGSILHLSADKKHRSNNKSIDPERTGQRSVSLYHPFESVIRSTNSTPAYFMSTIWRHDPELGRGYLLISDAINSGRVWRWEVGGGPISIGRSLLIDKSGCRSGHWNVCPSNRNEVTAPATGTIIQEGETCVTKASNLMGSAGIAIQTDHKGGNYHAGWLIIAERGERRIVRMEENGARTPLIVQIPSLCQNMSDTNTKIYSRIHEPGILLYTPYGDLLFTDILRPKIDQMDAFLSTSNSVAGVYRVRDIRMIPNLLIQYSHESHAWDSATGSKDTNQSGSDKIAEPAIDLIFSGNLTWVSSLVLLNDLKTFMVGGAFTSDDSSNLRFVIYKVPLDDFDEDQNDDTLPTQENRFLSEDFVAGKTCDQSLTSHCCKSENGWDQNYLMTDCKSLRSKGLYDLQATIFFDMTSYFEQLTIPHDMVQYGPVMTADSIGNLYVSYPGGVLIIDSSGLVLASIPLDESLQDRTPTSMSFGQDDSYLYVTTKTSLLRIRIKVKPQSLPINLVPS